MVIEAGGLVIDVCLKHLDHFMTIENYKVSKQPTFFLKQIEEPFQFEYQHLEAKTEYYELYDTNLGKLQIQFYGSHIVGEILYQDKTIYLHTKIDCFDSEYLLSQYAFVYWVKKYTNGMFIHSSSINYMNSGIMFCAKSGTGKSTQRRLWEEVGHATCINDDKNVLVFNGKELEIMPNPWSGKHFKNTNLKTQLKAIVFLKQAKENQVENITKLKAFNLLLKQIQLPSKENEDNWNHLIDLLLDLPIVEFGCNMKKEAFYTLEKELRNRGVFDEIKG